MKLLIFDEISLVFFIIFQKYGDRIHPFDTSFFIIDTSMDVLITPSGMFPFYI